MTSIRTFWWSALLFIAGILFSPNVWGHTQLVGSDPEAGALLQESPSEIVLTFSQKITLVTVSMVGPDGSIVKSVNEGQENGPRVILPVTAVLDAGQYIVSFRVLSGDSHPIDGTFQFGIAASSEERSIETHGKTSDVPVSPANTPAIVVSNNANVSVVLEQIVRAVFIVTLLLTIGLVLFRILITLPDDLEVWVVQLTRSASHIGMLLVAAYFVLATLGIVGVESFRPGHLRIILESSLGASLIAAFIGLLLLSMSGVNDRSFGPLGASVIVGSRVLTGHPVSQEPSWVLVPTMAIHFAAAAFWFAALWVILRLLRNGPFDAVPRVLAGFVRAATWSLCALMTAGLAMAAVHLGSVAALLRTDYGQFLLWKLLGVGGLMLVAVINRWFLTPDYLRHRESIRITTSIRFEALLMIAVIAMSTLLATTSPASRVEVSTQEARVPVTEFDPQRSVE